MSDMGVAVWISIIAVVIGLPAATYYPFMFGRVRFWESDIGKSMFTKGVALAAVFWVGIGTIGAAIWDWDWYQWARAATNCLLVFAVWYQVIVMRRVQKDGLLAEKLRRKRPPHES